MDIQRLRTYVSFVAMAITLASAGCGDGGTGRRQVSGTATLDGQPVENGEIVFYPTDGAGTPEGGPITAGRFQFPAMVGSKRIEITATREAATRAPDGLPNYVSYIPAKYNRKSTLTQTVEDNADNVFVFEMSSSER